MCLCSSTLLLCRSSHWSPPHPTTTLILLVLPEDPSRFLAAAALKCRVALTFRDWSVQFVTPTAFYQEPSVCLKSRKSAESSQTLLSADAASGKSYRAFLHTHACIQQGVGKCCITVTWVCSSLVLHHTQLMDEEVQEESRTLIYNHTLMNLVTIIKNLRGFFA